MRNKTKFSQPLTEGRVGGIVHQMQNGELIDEEGTGEFVVGWRTHRWCRWAGGRCGLPGWHGQQGEAEEGLKDRCCYCCHSGW